MSMNNTASKANLYSRPALIESIATASALAWTADTDSEYMHWDNRRAELEQMAGTINPEEMDTIGRISISKQDIYNQKS